MNKEFIVVFVQLEYEQARNCWRVHFDNSHFPVLGK